MKRTVKAWALILCVIGLGGIAEARPIERYLVGHEIGYPMNMDKPWELQLEKSYHGWYWTAEKPWAREWCNQSHWTKRRAIKCFESKHKNEKYDVKIKP